MKPRRNNSDRRNGGAAVSASGNSKKAPRVPLEATEVSVLLKACLKYRALLPAYLRSVQPELEAVNEVIRKLSLMQENR
jgi:hypothetical protein